MNRVFTCGPASEAAATLSLIARRADALRLNIAHMTTEKLQQWLDRLVELRRRENLGFRIVLDLQGAKVRIGRLPEVTHLPETVELFYGEVSDAPGMIPVPTQSVFEKTEPGDCLLLNDRRVILRVTGRAGGRLQAAVEKNGPLSSGKGLNSPDRVFEMAKVTEHDASAIAMSKEIADLDYAVSFVADGSESRLFRPLVGISHRLIAKIEQRAAFSHLAAIDAVFDEFWLCRGDLGAEAGLRKLGAWQADFVKALPGLKNPCLLAGEVLGSMVALPNPSRAEIVQLYDAIQARFAGFVLSDETACGTQIAAVMQFIDYFFADDQS